MREHGSKRKNVLSSLLQSSPDDGDVATMIQEALTKNGVVQLGSTSGGTGSDSRPKLQQSVQMRSDETDLAALARPAEVLLGSKLELLLETKVEEGRSHRKSGKKVNARKISGVCVGRTSVFRRDEESDGINTAVEILLDMSGSMFSNSDPLNVVSKVAAYAIAETLTRHEIPLGITAYGETIFKVKTFEDKWKLRRPFLNVDSLGSTNTGGALEVCAEGICVRPERRRMVVLLTDGDADDNDFALAAMNELSALDVEFATVFIGTSGRELEVLLAGSGYPVTRVLRTQELPEALFQAISSAF